MPAEVDAVVAEPARDREVLGGEIDEERTALVGARTVPFGELEQRVADDDARDLPRAEDPRGATREEVDVRDREEIELLPADVAQELVVLARVPADLLDDEAGAGLRLLAELEVLRHHLPLVALVVRDHAAEEEVRAVEAPPRLALVVEARVHVREEAQEADRVDVEDRRGKAPVTHDRVVAGKREHVVEPGRGELPAAALERVPVPVLAGEVDDHLLAARDHVRPERVRGEHRVTARVVRDREHVDPGVVGELARQGQQLGSAVRREQPAAGDDLGRDDEGAGLSEVLAERDHRS